MIKIQFRIAVDDRSEIDSTKVLSLLGRRFDSYEEALETIKNECPPGYYQIGKIFVKE